METRLSAIDRVVFEVAERATGGPRALSLRGLLLVVIVAGGLYGAVMGSFFMVSAERAVLVLIGATKVPMLVLVTTAICIPAFFVLNTIAGLREDWAAALRCVLASQAAFAVALLSLAPAIRVTYWSGATHVWAILWNSTAFLVAAILAHAVLRRAYRPLVRTRPAHRVMLVAWMILYSFVGVQTGWMLRPFVGKPDLPVAYFRDGAFTNAYVELTATVLDGLRSSTRRDQPMPY